MDNKKQNKTQQQIQNSLNSIISWLIGNTKTNNTNEKNKKNCNGNGNGTKKLHKIDCHDLNEKLIINKKGVECDLPLNIVDKNFKKNKEGKLFVDTSKENVDELIHVEWWKQYLAGVFASFGSLFIGFPFDTIKIRMQMQKKPSLIGVFKSIQKTGVKSLFNGILLPTLTSIIESSISFGVYKNTIRSLEIIQSEKKNKKKQKPSFFKIKLQKFTKFLNKKKIKTKSKTSTTISTNTKTKKNEKSKICKKIENNSEFVRYYFNSTIASTITGIASCFIVSPVDMVQAKTSAAIGNPSHIYYGKSSLFIIKDIYLKHGIKGVYSGMGPTFLRDIPSWVVYFVSYEFLKNVCGESTKSYLFSGGVAGVVSWLSTYPFDIIKSEIQLGNYDSQKERTIRSIAQSIYKEKGIGGFYQGFSITALRAFPVNAIYFFGYEYSIRMINRWFKKNKNKQFQKMKLKIKNKNKNDH